MKKLLFKNGPQALPHEAVNYDTASFSIRINVPYTEPVFPGKPVAPPSGPGKYGNLRGLFTSGTTSSDWFWKPNGKTNQLPDRQFDVPWNEQLTNLDYAFEGTHINRIEQLPDLSMVTRMAYCFYNCQDLVEINTKTWNTSNVNDMSGMFAGCMNLQTVDLNILDTTRVTHFDEMFLDCQKLNCLHMVNNWNTSVAESMILMFANCTNCESTLNLSLRTERVTDMQGMFQGCGVTQLKLDFPIVSLTHAPEMFAGCNNLSLLDVVAWGNDVTRLSPYDVEYFLSGANNLKEIRIGNVQQEAYDWWCARANEAMISTAIIRRY